MSTGGPFGLFRPSSACLAFGPFDAIADSGAVGASPMGRWCWVLVGSGMYGPASAAHRLVPLVLLTADLAWPTLLMS